MLDSTPSRVSRHSDGEKISISLRARAYQLGYAAGLIGSSIAVCPHDYLPHDPFTAPDIRLADAWLMGWIDGTEAEL